MAKLSRNILKGIVKECLVEILSEGLDDSMSTLSESRLSSMKTNRSIERNSKVKKKKSAADSMIQNPNFNQNIKKTAESLTSDPVLSTIFQDTARTTLQEQVSAEKMGTSSMQGDAAARAVSNSDPSDVFGESSDRWASLAFSDDLLK